jgi:hypothetical protein
LYGLSDTQVDLCGELALERLKRRL